MNEFNGADLTRSDEVVTKKVYPLVEEMTFRAIIASEQDGYKLLRAIQILVNELGGEQIVSIMDKMESNPSLMQKAKSYLPYLKYI